MFRSLLNREINSVFSSVYSLIFALLFFLVNGLMLWFFSGNYNILDNGYASLERFFSLSSSILLLLLPSLTMRSVSEEKLTKTLYLQYSRPIPISALFFSKVLTLVLYICIILLISFIYLFSIYKLGNPIGNIDLQTVYTSYLGLLLIASVFISWGIVTSCLSKYAVVSFILSFCCNCIFFYGFDFISGLVSNGKMSLFIQSLGLLSHFKNFQRGIIAPNDLIVLFNYVLVAWCISIFILRPRIKQIHKTISSIIVFTLIINLLVSILPSKKYDFTDDKRYTLSDSTKKFLKSLNESEDHTLKINFYLSGNINYSFQRLADATSDIISDFDQYLKKRIDFRQVQIENLSIPPSSNVESYMKSKGMPPIVLNERSREGKITQQLIYPYAEIIYDQDTIPTLLLKKLPGYTAEENINISIEDLESEFIEAIRTLTANEENHIAFIEGHGELDRAYIYDVEEALAKYYFIDRGRIGNRVGILDQFKVVIIAGPKDKYTEAEKYILDQYVMQGGRVLWLIDGTFLSEQDLKNKGQSASIKNEHNLDDLLFTYGIRVNSNLVQDAQCSDIIVNNGDNSQSVIAPWYYAPILLPSIDNIISKNVGGIKSEFVSSIDFIRNKDTVDKKILLTTSGNTHIVNIPEMIDFNFNRIESQKNYFNESYISVAVALEGSFSSAFINRTIPDSIINADGYIPKKLSKPTRMILISSSSIIKNEIIGEGNNSQVLPLGYDKLSCRQYGNKEFIVNAVNWLSGTTVMNDYFVKKQTLRLLDKQKILVDRNFYLYLNLLLPLLIISIIYILAVIYRKIRYCR